MKFETYKDKAGEFRWRLVVTNGNTIATSGEGYKNRTDMIQTINSMRQGVPHAKIEEVESE